MKKTLYCMLLCAIFLASCNSPKEYDPKNINSDDRPFAIETMQKIITAFDEEDHAALLELFSESAKENYDLEMQIVEAMEYYKGKSITTVDDVSRCGHASVHMEDGIYKQKSIRVVLLNVETDAKELYSIEFLYTLVDEEPSQIGISKLYFVDWQNGGGYELTVGSVVN